MTRNQEIARTILAQLGGGKFIAMTGAKNFVAMESALFFALPKFSGVKINRVQVLLMPDDTYTVTFFRAFGAKLTPLKIVEQVYAEDLRRVFTDATGLETSLGRVA